MKANNETFCIWLLYYENIGRRAQRYHGVGTIREGENALIELDAKPGQEAIALGYSEEAANAWLESGTCAAFTPMAVLEARAKREATAQCEDTAHEHRHNTIEDIETRFQDFDWKLVEASVEATSETESHLHFKVQSHYGNKRGDDWMNISVNIRGTLTTGEMLAVAQKVQEAVNTQSNT